VDHMTPREAAKDHSGGIWNSAVHQQSVARPTIQRGCLRLFYVVKPKLPRRWYCK
jgi:hypothetical protein